jgi:hypothetical protein
MKWKFSTVAPVSVTWCGCYTRLIHEPHYHFLLCRTYFSCRPGVARSIFCSDPPSYFEDFVHNMQVSICFKTENKATLNCARKCLTRYGLQHTREIEDGVYKRHSFHAQITSHWNARVVPSWYKSFHALLITVTSGVLLLHSTCS